MKFVNHTVRKKYYLGLFLLFIGSVCFAQNQQTKGDFWENVRFYGGLGINFSNGGFNGSISPGAVYQFNNQFAAGLGANVNFYKFNNQKFWAYGPSAIVLFDPIKQIQISGEFETLRINSSIQTTTNNIQENFWQNALFFGVGYRTEYAIVGVRYNVLYDAETSIYLNAWTPFVRLSF